LKAEPYDFMCSIMAQRPTLFVKDPRLTPASTLNGR
jgi:hypothetical protein